MSLKKIVLISGPTATGKTKLAVKLTKIFPALLISADSRQVYQGMDIVTGKDHPPQIKLACLDILKPDEKISVALWRQCALKAIASAYSQNQLPIIVGGTNFYLKSLTSNIETITIPPNLSLRRILSAKTAVELQAILNKLNPTKLKRMNNSDRHNPRRLIRAIEVATYYQTHSFPPSSHTPQFTPLQFALKPPPYYSKIIRQRVIQRIKAGALKETELLLRQYPSNLESFTGIGYRSIIAYLQGKLTKEEMISQWTHNELSLAKQQLTWLRQQQDIIWLDPINPSIFAQVVKRIKTWYYSS